MTNEKIKRLEDVNFIWVKDFYDNICDANISINLIKAPQYTKKNIKYRGLLSSIELKNPKASVEPWLFTTGPCNPKNIAPLYFLGSNFFLN